MIHSTRRGTAWYSSSYPFNLNPTVRTTSRFLFTVYKVPRLNLDNMKVPVYDCRSSINLPSQVHPSYKSYL